jgi:hypothetical protein
VRASAGGSFVNIPTKLTKNTSRVSNTERPIQHARQRIAVTRGNGANEALRPMVGEGTAVAWAGMRGKPGG